MGFDDFDFLETIDLTEGMPEETPSRKHRRPDEAKEPTPSTTRTSAPTQSTRPSGLSANLHTPQASRKQINDRYDSELLDLEMEIRRKKIELARREALEKAGLA
jgi:hypothetical protein